MIAAKLSDPGADGPLARYARMPRGMNGKHSPPFSCRLTQWHPDSKYSLEAIVEGLKLSIPSPSAKIRTRHQPGRGARIPHTADAEGLDVYTPRPDENTVISVLQQRGLYKAPLGSGKHDITCPWVNEHTDAVDQGTAYFEPDDEFPIGGFHCLHGHCAGRRVSALLDCLGVTPHAAKHKPTIRVAAGELNRIVDIAEYELSKTGRYFQRGSAIVSVATDPSTGETTITPLSQSSLMRALSRIALWERFDKRANDYFPTDPPTQHTVVLFNGEQYPHMPVLNGITRQPYLRQDGSLMTQAGYDRATGMFGAFNTRDFDIPTAPTRAQALHAMKELNGLLSEFAFATDQDRIAALGGIVTAAIRSSLPQAPMFHISAAEIGSGKSYLASLIATFAMSSAPPVLSFPDDDEECRKLLLSMLMTGVAVMLFDNLVNDLLPHKSLCSALTEPFITGRILGVSKTATVDTRTLFLSTGNNVEAVRDMSRRTITITLDPMCEKPATREFNASPLRVVHAKRGYYVSLALTIVRAWIVAGRPATLPCKPLGSYDAWTELVRQPLLWLGAGDPAISVFTGMSADPDRETLARLLSVWHEMFGSQPMMVRDLVKAVSDERLSSKGQDLKDMFDDVASDRSGINRLKLGRWLARNQGRVVNGLRLGKAQSTRNADQWQVVSIKSVLSVNSAACAQSVNAKNVDEANSEGD
jgi:hypothetical protein